MVPTRAKHHVLSGRKVIVVLSLTWLTPFAKILQSFILEICHHLECNNSIWRSSPKWEVSILWECKHWNWPQGYRSNEVIWCCCLSKHPCHFLIAYVRRKLFSKQEENHPNNALNFSRMLTGKSPEQHPKFVHIVKFCNGIGWC